MIVMQFAVATPFTLQFCVFVALVMTGGGSRPAMGPTAAYGILNMYVPNELSVHTWMTDGSGFGSSRALVKYVKSSSRNVTEKFVSVEVEEFVDEPYVADSPTPFTSPCVTRWLQDADSRWSG